MLLQVFLSAREEGRDSDHERERRQRDQRSIDQLQLVK